MAKKQKSNPKQERNREASQMDAGQQQPPRQQSSENFLQGRERASDLNPAQQGHENFLQGRERACDPARGGQR